MTSRALFFNLTKEELKNKIWLIALTQLMLFCALPLRIAMTLSRNARYYNGEYNGGIADPKINDVISTASEGFFLLLFVIGSGLVIGISMFSYLFSKKKVDTFHSLPVSRRLYFFMKLTSGFLIFAAALILQYLLMLILCAGLGAPLAKLLPSLLYLLALHLFGFLVSYLLAVICAILSGNLIVSGLLYGIFALLPIEIISMISNYSADYFSTYFYSIETTRLKKIEAILSPFFCYTKSTGAVNVRESTVYGLEPLVFLYFPIVIALFCLIAYVLFQKHPSEAAGNALAFPKSATPIRLIVMLMSALLGSLFFGEMSGTGSRLGWTVFGFAFGLLLSFVVANAVIYSDFRRALTKLSQLGIAATVMALFYCSFVFDWYSFDSYLPKVTELSSVGINFSGLIEFRQLYETNKNGNPDYNTYPNETTLMQNIHLNPEKYYDFLSRLVKSQEEQGEYTEPMSAALPIPSPTPVDTRSVSAPTSANTQTVFVSYQLKNGTEKCRQYQIRLDDANRKDIYAIYDDSDYRIVTFPILSVATEDIRNIHVSNYNGHTFLLTLSQEEKEELFDLFKASLREQTAADRINSLPVGRLVLSYCRSDSEQEKSQEYYIYPEFTEVIQFLTKHGGEFETKSEQVQSITVQFSERYYKNFMYLNSTHAKEMVAQTYDNPASFQLLYKDPEKIAALMEHAVLQDYTPDSFLMPAISVFVLEVVCVIDDYGNEIHQDYILPQDKLPKFLLDDAEALINR